MSKNPSVTVWMKRPWRTAASMNKGKAISKGCVDLMQDSTICPAFVFGHLEWRADMEYQNVLISNWCKYVVLIVLSIVLSIKKLNRCSVLTWIKLGPVPNRMIALGFFWLFVCFVLFFFQIQCFLIQFFLNSLPYNFCTFCQRVPYHVVDASNFENLIKIQFEEYHLIGVGIGKDLQNNTHHNTIISPYTGARFILWYIHIVC